MTEHNSEPSQGGVLLTLQLNLPESTVEDLSNICTELCFEDSSLESRQKAIEVLQKVMKADIVNFKSIPN